MSRMAHEISPAGQDFNKHSRRRNSMVKSLVFASVLVAATAGLYGLGQSHHVITNLAEAQWGAAPPMLPHGAQMTVLSGDPTKPAPYAVRLKFPANYSIPAHSHPTDENVVVTSGSLTLGMGDKLTKGAGNTTLHEGGYALMPAHANHFAFTTTGETTIVLFGMGPVEFKYVNPSDDPRHTSTSR
jgi:quercetin dioxygenase-like cupin family protein